MNQINRKPSLILCVWVIYKDDEITKTGKMRCIGHSELRREEESGTSKKRKESHRKE